jgi:hypothetical protein
VITYDQARQLGKVYVGALNTGDAEYAALFAPGADVRLGGEAADPAAVRATVPPGRTGFRGAALAAPYVVVTLRITDPARQVADDREHRLVVDDAGRIAGLEA